MITLYETHQPQLDTVAARGGHNIREMAKRFTRSTDMDEALGFSRGTVRHWIEGSSNFAKASDACAANWLKANPAPEPQPRQEQPKPTTGTMLLVVCDNATAERAKKMLALIGCEVTEV